MKVLMTVMSDVVRDARVLREARTLQEVGHEVTIFGLRPIDAETLTSLPDDLDIRWIGGQSPFPRGRNPRRNRRLFRLARWAMLPTHIQALERSFHDAVLEHTQAMPVDVVHAHDFDTLELAATIAARAGARLVYDSHEAWLHRRRPGRGTPLHDLRVARVERRLGHRADAIITVSPTLGRWMERRYGWTHVTIVRNTFPLKEAQKCRRRSGPPEALVYAGRIGAGRDIETLVAAAERLTDIRLVLIGPSDPSFRLSGEQLEVRAPVPVDEVDEVLHDAGLAVVAMADGPLNHRVALPNKLFQAVRAGVPVIAVDLPQLRQVVTSHGLGTLYTPGDADSFVRAVAEVVDRYDEFCNAVEAARPELSWAVDGARLTQVYDRLHHRARS